MRLVIILPIIVFLFFAGCDVGQKEITQEDVKDYFSDNRVGSFSDYAVIKNGTDHLITVHGYADDLSVCLSLIEPYNRDASLSVFAGQYTCVPLNN